MGLLISLSQEISTYRALLRLFKMNGGGWSSRTKLSHCSTSTALITGKILSTQSSDDSLRTMTARMINVGSLTGIITTLLEKNIGFGVAFLVPLIFVVLGMILFVASSKAFGKRHLHDLVLRCCTLLFYTWYSLITNAVPQLS